MLEIIPNWHPIFVHFTVALFSTSVGFYTLAHLFKEQKFYPKLAPDFEIVARWCLWTGSIIVIGTILTGFYAYYTVKHDTPSHLVMTAHRNWAIPTASAMVLVALWSLWRTYNRKAVTISFIITLFIVQGLLLSTAWRGAELVFRYGIGVMSLPKAAGEGHPNLGEKIKAREMNHSNMPASNHQHDHGE